MNKVSVIYPVYNSHRIFNEQLFYLNIILKSLDNFVEVIFVDDGSSPPLEITNFNTGFSNFRLLKTNSTMIWNQPAARNLGARHALGDYLFFVDIDHIITRAITLAIINAKRYFRPGDNAHDMIKWNRLFGILKNGKVLKTKSELVKYGLDEKLFRRDPFGVCNIFAIEKMIFDDLGGYDENFCGRYGGDDEDFMRRFNFNGYSTVISCIDCLYVYPNPREDKFFHDLHRQAFKKGRGYEIKK